MQPESRIQCSLCDWWAVACRGYRLDHRLLAHVPNGGKRSKIEASILKGMGVRAGHEDMVLAVPFRRDDVIVVPGLYLEIKSEDGRLRPEQKEMMRLHAEQGYAVSVAWKVNEGIGAICNYLKTGDPHKIA